MNSSGSKASPGIAAPLAPEQPPHPHRTRRRNPSDHHPPATSPVHHRKARFPRLHLHHLDAVPAGDKTPNSLPVSHGSRRHPHGDAHYSPPTPKKLTTDATSTRPPRAPPRGRNAATRPRTPPRGRPSRPIHPARAVALPGGTGTSPYAVQPELGSLPAIRRESKRPPLAPLHHVVPLLPLVGFDPERRFLEGLRRPCDGQESQDAAWTGVQPRMIVAAEQNGGTELSLPPCPGVDRRALLTQHSVGG